MEVTATEISDVKLIRSRRFEDRRGYFTETYSQRVFHEAGIAQIFVQDNHVLSVAAGTLRGLHFQIPPHAQTKLVRVVRGAVLDVAVDIRVNSPTYGRHVARTLTAERGEQLLVPTGFAHGYCTLEPMTEVIYKVDEYFAPSADFGIAAYDPDLSIAWPFDAAEIVRSEKDEALPRLRDCGIFFRLEKLIEAEAGSGS